ncbi:hypothetical protein [uncultured Ruminococcus sp.]|uniref:hypothetical protein n=1 Tax=uncultured Ruminococcus sp. TaxID=165186 RepID=UPI00292EEFB3|nr:hypothetical protein [uncultured Ruminococcus sp.]
MRLFKESFVFTDFPRIVFLCGNKYSNKANDKRNVLKNYIIKKHPEYKVIILEENFFFRKTNQSYLSYDDVMLNNLKQIEQLASAMSDKVIIIHETISTAAELGMFMSGQMPASKICLLVPDSMSIDEKKLSGFINYAFFRHNMESDRICRIKYYPDVLLSRKSKDTGYFLTFFHNDCIGANLGERIEKFLNRGQQSNNTINIIRNKYDRPSDNNNIEYWAGEEGKQLHIYVSAQAFKAQMCALFNIKSVMSELRKYIKLYKHVDWLAKQYDMILTNTISELSGINMDDYSTEIRIKGYDYSLRDMTAFYLYMLQAASLISLVEKDAENSQLRKVSINSSFYQTIAKAKGLLTEKKASLFERTFT